MAEVLATGRMPHINTFAPRSGSPGGVETDDIRGAQFAAGGEPMTAARLATIRGAGAVAVPRYSTMEAGPIAYGCLAPEAPDDQHLFHDLNAVIQAGSDGKTAHLPGDALLLTSLRPTVSIVLLNVSLGDQATVVRRRVPSPVWGGRASATHPKPRKLTVGGMTFLTPISCVSSTSCRALQRAHRLQLVEEAEDGHDAPADSPLWVHWTGRTGCS
jgi:hypothetical protein